MPGGYVVRDPNGQALVYVYSRAVFRLENWPVSNVIMVTELRGRLSDFARGFAKQEDVMKRTSKLLSGSVLALVVATTLASPAFAYSAAEGYAACIGDATRYCASAMPNIGRTAACLRGQKQKISKPCQAALSAFGY
jgi:molybdopterin biosynthesis enzyme